MVHGDDVTDDTLALNAALSAGDVYIESGTYLISGEITVASGRHIQCQCNTPSGVCTATTDSNGMITGSIQGISAYLDNYSATAGGMLGIGILGNNDVGNSIFYCGFRGQYVNNTNPPCNTNEYTRFVTLGQTSNVEIVANDWNGIPGGVAAILINGGTSSNTNNNAIVSWNTAEHCGYYFLQISGAIGTTVQRNTLNDCSGMIEGNGGTEVLTNTSVDHNHLTFTHGIPYTSTRCPGSYGFNGLTCGIAPGSQSYTSETCSSNIIDGTHASGLMENASGDPATYTNNTCTGGCGMNNYSQ